MASSAGGYPCNEPEKTEGAEADGEEEADDAPTELVGYLEDPPDAQEKKLLTRRMFPSKVGGKPAWLVPQNLPELICKKCERPLRFLLQVYASRGSDNAGAFHRVLKIFICTSCQPNEVRAYRCQLPRENDFYSSDAPDQDKILATAHSDPELEDKICWDCGLPCAIEPVAAPIEEDGVEEVAREDAEVSNRCEECARLLRNEDPIAVFQERELTCCEAEEPEEECWDIEDEAEADDDAAVEETALADAELSLKTASPAQDAGDVAMLEKLQAFKDQVAQDPEHAIDRSEQRAFEDFQKKEGVQDHLFSKFQRFSTTNESHVIRHVFGGAPLWFSSPNRLTEDPPACPCCGGARHFELQVQPQLISLLTVGSAAERELPKRLEYGSIYVYVCKNSCNPGSNAPYLEEFVHVQPEPREDWLPK